MQLITHEIELDTNIFLMGDDHEGASLRHAKGWGKMIDAVRGEYLGVSNNVVVDHGDIVEAVTSDDPRYTDISVEGVPLGEMQQAIRNRQGIQDRLVCIMDGNHPRKLHRVGDITKFVCDALGVEYGTWSAIITYTHKGKPLFRHYATHGFGSINSTIDNERDRKNSMLRSLRKKLQNKANCLLNSMGHTHKLLVYKPEKKLYLSPEKGKVKQHYTSPPSGAGNIDNHIPNDDKWYVNTGSFYRTYMMGSSGYAEVAGYDPIELGYAVAEVRGGVLKDVHKVVL